MASSFGFFVKEGIGIRLLCDSKCEVVTAVHPGIRIEVLQEAHCRDHSTDPVGAEAAGRGCEACGWGTQEETGADSPVSQGPCQEQLSGFWRTGAKARQSTSESPKWHLFGLQEASCCPCTVAMATTVQRLLRACSEEKGGVEGTW